ncbi:ankyrin repeat-containing domain protein [Nemania abortiva]|nr:ankyrin repeat-containing domain protein [Nemania abortiva]
MASTKDRMNLQLISGEPGYASTFDIILVQGPGQTLDQCWTAEASTNDPNLVWPRNIVGPILGVNGRVFAFNYDSNDRELLNVLSPERIQDVALGLLDCLQRSLPVRERMGKSTKPDVRTPIAFIAHGIGGILVKQALVAAASSAQHYHVMQKTVALLFFGTPHRTLSFINSWEDILTKISPKLPLFHVISPAATQIQDLSLFLDELSDQFIHIAPRQRIINIIEQVGDTTDPRPSLDNYSSTTGLVHELNITRACRHEDLGKLTSRDSVVSRIFDMLLVFKKMQSPEHRLKYRSVESLPTGDKSGKYDKCLLHLSKLIPPFIIPYESQRYIMGHQSPLPDEHLSWLDSSSSCVITTATQGVAVEGIEAAELFRESQKRGFHSCYFSFSDAGIRRNSVTGLLASLIFQSLHQNPKGFAQVRKVYNNLRKEHIWSQSALAVLFRSVLNTKSDPGPIHIIIDGLHRCSAPDEALDILWAAFDDKERCAKIKLAFFYGENPGINEVLKKFDLFRKHYSLSADKPLPFHTNALTYKVLYTVAGESLPQSSVLGVLKECDDHEDLTRAITAVLPNPDTHQKQSLDRLIATTLTTVEDIVSDYLENLVSWARIALGWILHSKRPLSFKELATAIGFTGIRAEFRGSFDTAMLTFDLASGLRKQFGFLLTTETGGISFSTNRIKHCCQEFARRELDANINNQEIRKTAIPGEADITKILIEYLRLKEVLGPISRAAEADIYIQPTGSLFNLASYAVQFWVAHYRESVRVDGSNSHIASKICGIIGEFQSLLGKIDEMATHPQYYDVDTLPCLAAQFGFTSIMEEAVKNDNFEDWASTINAASRWGHSDIVEIILRARPTEEKNLDPDLERFSAIKEAVSYGNGSVMRLIFQHLKDSGLINPCLLDALIRRTVPLGDEVQFRFLFYHYNVVLRGREEVTKEFKQAIKLGHSSIVRILLNDRLADIQWELAEKSPIALAAKNGHYRVINYLLPFYSNANTMTTKAFRSAVELAAEGGHETAVKVLLERFSPHEPATTTNQYGVDKRSFLVDLLLSAIRKDHYEVAKLLCQHNANMTKSDMNHTLIDTISRGDSYEPLALMILDHLASLGRMKDFDYFAEPFRRAAEAGLMEVIKKFMSIQQHQTIQLHECVNELPGRDVVHYAAISGQLETVRFLSQITKCDRLDKQDLTPLALAARSGHIETVKFLMEKMANGEKPSHHYSRAVNYMSSFPGPSCQAEIIRLLVAHGANPNQMIINWAIYAKFQPANPHQLDCLRHEKAAIHQASLYSNLEAVQALLQCGADIKLKSKSGWHALHYAAVRSHRDATRVCEVLIEAGCNPLDADEKGWLPFHVACMAGNTQVMDLLIGYGEDMLQVKAHDGRAVLDFGWDQLESLKWLLKRGMIDVNAAITEDGETALMRYILDGNVESARLLKARGAKADFDVEWMRKALYRVCNGHEFDGRELEIVKFLVLELGADVNAQGGKHNTVLTAALLAGHKDLPEFLLEQGADPSLPGGEYPHALAAAIEGDAEESLIIKLRHILMPERREILSIWS